MDMYTGNFNYNEVTIPNGQTSSEAMDLNGLGLVGIIIPAAFTGTALSFTSSYNNTTFTPLYNTEGNLLSMAVSTNRYICIEPSDLIGIRFIKLVSNASEGADRKISLVTREFQ